MKLALVSGAHGFLGSHLTERFLADGWRVRALVSPWGRLDKLSHLPQERIDIVRGDIGESSTLAGCCDRVDVIVHAAARVADYGPWEAFERTNVRGTENLLREAERAGVARFLLVSSVAVFHYRGFRNADARTLERDNRVQPYARSKIEAEDLVMASDRCDPVVLRPGLWPFGARDDTFVKIARALRRGQLPLVGSGSAVLNTAYAENFADGALLAATSPAAAGRSYTLGDDGAPSWNELFAELARLLGVAPPRIHLPEGPLLLAAGGIEALWRRFRPYGEPPLTSYRAGLTVHDVHFDLSSARQELGHVPAVGWREGLRRTVAAIG
jgi:nucleoside-diphosphate-sugar epimerase